jgi:hypothetical protein
MIVKLMITVRLVVSPLHAHGSSGKAMGCRNFEVTMAPNAAPMGTLHMSPRPAPRIREAPRLISMVVMGDRGTVTRR